MKDYTWIVGAVILGVLIPPLGALMLLGGILYWLGTLQNQSQKESEDRLAKKIAEEMKK